jgi:hypothetical protein
MKTKTSVLRFEGVTTGTPVSLMYLSSAKLRQAANVKDKIGKLQKRFSQLLSIEAAKPAVLKPARKSKRPKMALAARKTLGRSMRRSWRLRRKKQKVQA